MRHARGLGAVTLACACAAAVAVATAAGHGSRIGPNLLRNGDGSLGAYSAQGWDSVTIPGWRVSRGLPTVVLSGTRGFPDKPRLRGASRLFAGGPGGTAILSQTVSLRSPRGGPVASGTSYRLSGWLGGNKNSAASLTAVFVSGAGKELGRGTVGPVGSSGRPLLAQRSAAGVLPPGTAAARIVLELGTSLTNYDGPNAPLVGYDRAIAGRLRFSVSTPVRAPARLAPPKAHVPRFDHVFLFMFENQDFRAVIGKRRRAPYLNSLITSGSLLSNLYAEEHPSDANYLAIAAGGAFGIPLTNPLESNPRFSIKARNLGDLINASHGTWRAYMQTAAGPCDDTVHGYYWNDDLPFLYFPDVRDRPAYCAAHVVPLEAISADLASPSTTPDFAWIGADDCSDMEGCGPRVGDAFLARTLGAIMRSPAWLTQRSLAIITMDEDGYDHEHPPQLVPTLVIGSSAVRRGYVSHVRYTHYSLLKTIEAALGLGRLTLNDRYARALNDVFDARVRARAVVAAPRLEPANRDVPRAPAAAFWGPAALRRPAAFPKPALRPRPALRVAPSPTALVANYQSDSVTPVSLATRKPGRPIPVGSAPVAIALTPNAHTAYVANSGSGTVTPIDTATLTAGRAIPVGADPCAILVSPDGRTAYVVDGASNAVTPIDTATGRPRTPIPVGAFPRSIVLAPNRSTAYVLDWGGASVTPIDLATSLPGPAIPVGSYPVAMTFSPDGATGFVADYGSDTVTPISTATNKTAGSISVGQAPNSLVVSPDGARLMVVSGDRNSVMSLATATGQAYGSTHVGYSPDAIALAPGGATAWVVSTIAGTVTPISTGGGRAGRPVSVGLYSYPTSITFAPGSATAVVLNTYAGTVSLLNTSTNRAARAIRVGGYPDAVAITH